MSDKKYEGVHDSEKVQRFLTLMAGAANLLSNAGIRLGQMGKRQCFRNVEFEVLTYGTSGGNDVDVQ